MQIRHALYGRAHMGFSLVEAILLISLVGILATVLVMNTGGQLDSVGRLKFESDVRQLNQMVNLYKADGGTFATSDQIGNVLGKLKNFRPTATLKAHTGAASGSLIDQRLVAEMGTGEPGRLRAVWSASKEQFEILSTGVSGAFGFTLDSELADEAGNPENRQRSSVVFDGSQNPSWVWSAPQNETRVPNIQISSIIGSGGTQNFDPNANKPVTLPPEEEEPEPPDPGNPGNPPNPPERLATPVISPSGGTYSYETFPSTITISANGAPPGGSILRYRIDGGEWIDYPGGTIAVTPGMRVEAQNFAAPGATNYLNSYPVNHQYFRLVSGFTGNVQTTIENVIGTDTLHYSVETPDANTSVFTHGNTQTELGNGEVFETGEANKITITTNPFDDIQPNQWFDFGMMQFLNGEIFNDSAASGLTLKLDFNMANPNITGTANINLLLINTDNVPNDPLASADIIRLANPTTNFTISIEGVNYTLQLAWQNNDPSAGHVQGNEFLVFEGGTASGTLRARFVSNQ